MNAKFAKALRAAAGYKNASATPSRAPFPGISARGYNAPAYHPRGTRVVSTLDPSTGRITRETLPSRLRVRSLDFEGLPAFELIPVTNPVRHENSPRASYRRLKRLARTDPRFVRAIRDASRGLLTDFSAWAEPAPIADLARAGVRFE